MSAKVTSLIHDVMDAAERLNAGQLVAFPTETVYGLGADALNVTAIARLFEAKQRPEFDPLIVHIAAFDYLSSVAADVPDSARELAHHFWPGPLTMVLPKRSAIPDLVTAGLPGVGVRIPEHPLALQLLSTVDCPVAAPSANRFGAVSPTTAEHVLHGLHGRIDAVLAGGSCRIGLESTVISLMQQDPVVLRLGGLPLEEIQTVTGPIQVMTGNPALSDAAQPAPGMLSRHYAPGATVVTVDADTAIQSTDRRTALLTWGTDPDNRDQFVAVENLSVSGKLAECAANFFAGLRKLDSENPDVIIARRFPDRGLGRALNDRLQRACG